MVANFPQPYQPGDIGLDVVEVPALEGELRQIGSVLADLNVRAPLAAAVLQGQPDPFTLGATPNTLVNYGLGLRAGAFPGSADQASGTITVDRPAVVRVTAHVAGVQGNNSFNEAAQLQLVRNGAPTVLATYEIPNNKTSERSWNASVMLNEAEATSYALVLVATSGLGTFTFSTASLEIAVHNAPVIEK